MKEIQTPRKDLSHRRPKESPSSTTKSSISDSSKKSLKVAKKSLNAEFSSVSEDFASESLNDLFNFSPVSEVLTDSINNISNDSIDSFESSFTVEDAVTPSDSSASSKITTVDDSFLITSCDRIKELRTTGSVEAEVLASLLKQAKVEVSSSNDVSLGSKKLLDALVEVSVKDFCGLPDETELTTVLVSEKTRLLAFFFAVWVISMALILAFVRGSSARNASCFYLPPT